MMLKPNLNELGKLAKDKHIENKKYFDKLKKKAPKNLDYAMQELHDAEFKRTDCLTCANCCKTTGPLFTSADIERIAKHLRQKPQQFIEQYLRIDEDNDYVLQSVPCTFWIMTILALFMMFVQKRVGNFHILTEKNFSKLLI